MTHVDLLHKDNWNTVQAKVLMLQAQQKVIYYQPYALKEKDPRKRLFIVVFQDDFIKSVSQWFLYGNS